jgi:DNA-binding SARP family transcriptional activator
LSAAFASPRLGRGWIRAWRLRKARSVVKLLALTPGHRLHREHVIEALWPDRDPTAAFNNLR